MIGNAANFYMDVKYYRMNKFVWILVFYGVLGRRFYGEDKTY